MVAASLNEATYWSYAIGFPGPGRWLEVFNSDVYDNWVNPIVAGNGGGVKPTVRRCTACPVRRASSSRLTDSSSSPAIKEIEHANEAKGIT